MASYKVPQDVEADDKLIGPFTFRQFVYLFIVALCGVVAWGLSQLFIGLAIIPLPVMIFFGALALPLRKDQPMEIYMAAMVSYYLKPRQRMWDPEGVETLIEISAPKTVEVQRKKDLSENEAAQRLSYLADIVDTGGWAIRGATSAPTMGTSMNNDIYLEAQSVPDVLDTNTTVAHSFDQMMNQRTAQMHEEARAIMQEVAQHPGAPLPPSISPNSAQQVPEPPIPTFSSLPTAADPSDVQFNPYPTFRQSVIQPLNDAAHQARVDVPVPAPAPAAPTARPVSTPDKGPTTPLVSNPRKNRVRKKKHESASTTSSTELTAGIMNLANNPDISIETMAHQAKRLHEKAEDESDEVFVSLR